MFLSSDFDTLYASLDKKEKRMVFRSVIERVDIAEDKSVIKIVWK